MYCFPRIALALSLIVIHTSALASAPSNASETPAPINDAAVPRYLSLSEVLEWERAQDLLRVGRSQVATGEWLMNRPPSALRSAQDIAKDREDGRRQELEGKQKIESAEKTLDALRARAAATAARTQVQQEAVVYPLEFAPESLSKGLRAHTEKLLFDLWNQGFGRIYFGGAYVMDTADDSPVFLADPVLEGDLRRIISRLDGNRFTFVNDETITFKLNTTRGRTIIDFADRSQVLRHFKAAYIVAELVGDSQADSAILSLRGIDLTTMTVAAAQLIVLKVNDDIRKLFGIEVEAATTSEATLVVATDGEVTPGVADATAPESQSSTDVAKRLAIQLRDDNNFLQRVTSSGTHYIFTVEYKGDNTGFNGRTASMISKMLLLDNKLLVSDADFLPMVLDFSRDGEGVQEWVASNAIWKITPLGGGGTARTAYDVEAVSLIAEQPSSVPVGLMQTLLIEDQFDGS